MLNTKAMSWSLSCPSEERISYGQLMTTFNEQVADLHGVISKARGFNADLKADKDFLVVKISSRPGQLSGERPHKGWTKKSKKTGAVVEPTHTAVETSRSGMQIRPPGLSISLRLAGIEVNTAKLLPQKQILTARQTPIWEEILQENCS